MSRISVLGLGKLGACMAACFASRGHVVVGVDQDDGAVDRVNAGKPPIFEPGLDDLMSGLDGRLSATLDTAAAVGETDVTFIVVPTPSTEDGGYSLDYVLAAARATGTGLRQKSGYHLVVLTSTVLPGSTGGEVRRALEGASGKACGPDFGLCYSPEFIALGTVIRDFLSPDFVLIGESDSRAGDRLEELMRSTLDPSPPVARMSIVDAEIAKIGVNSFVTAKVAFANSLAELCRRMPGADVDAVTRAIGLDSRIGQKYLRGGMPFGGPCFPRDNRALAFVLSQSGVTPTFPEAVEAANDHHLRDIIEFVMAHTAAGPIAVLGLSYKPGSIVLDASPSLATALALADAGFEVRVYDHLLSQIRCDEVPDSLILTGSLPKALHGATAIVVGHPDGSFLDDQVLEAIRRSEAKTLLDCWRLLEDKRHLLEPVSYFAYGKSVALSHDLQER
jgi:UDPglucose 6-dehydrogenase